MKMSDIYINDQLNKAQKLLWGGSETENIEAHNIISKLIQDRMEQTDLTQGKKYGLRRLFTNPWKVAIMNKTSLERGLSNDNKA